MDDSSYASSAAEDAHPLEVDAADSGAESHHTGEDNDADPAPVHVSDDSDALNVNADDHDAAASAAGSDSDMVVDLTRSDGDVPEQHDGQHKRDAALADANRSGDVSMDEGAESHAVDDDDDVATSDAHDSDVDEDDADVVAASSADGRGRFHGYMCHNCGKGVGYHARRCRHCATAVQQPPLHAPAVLVEPADARPPTRRRPRAASSSSAGKRGRSAGKKKLTLQASARRTSPHEERSTSPRTDSLIDVLPPTSGLPATTTSTTTFTGDAARVVEVTDRHAYTHAVSRVRGSLPRANVSVPLSALDSCTPELIDAHVHALRAEALQRRFRPLLQRIMESPLNNGIFNSPVNPVELGILDYLTVVKHPMDLGTARQKLESGRYDCADELAADVVLVFSNSMTYNPPTHPIHIIAGKLREEFMTDFRKLTAKTEADAKRKDGHSCGFCQGEECRLCGDKCERFDPPVLSCDCCMERLKRGDTYYRAASGQRWCARCVSNNGANAEPGAVLPPPGAAKHAVTRASVLQAAAAQSAQASEQLMQAVLSATTVVAAPPPVPAAPAQPVILRLTRRKSTPAVPAATASTTSSSVTDTGGCVAVAPPPAPPVAETAPSASSPVAAAPRPLDAVSPTSTSRAQAIITTAMTGPNGSQLQELCRSTGVDVKALLDLAPRVAAVLAQQQQVLAASCSVDGEAPRGARSRARSSDATLRSAGSRLRASGAAPPYNRSRLEKRRHDDIVAEPWVQCDRCAGWVHQICAMFNARKNALLPYNVYYVCPLCKRDDMIAARSAAAPASGRAASTAATRLFVSTDAGGLPVVSTAPARLTRSTAAHEHASGHGGRGSASSSAMLVARYEGATAMASATALGVASADTTAPATSVACAPQGGAAPGQVPPAARSASTGADDDRTGIGDATAQSTSGDPLATAASLPHTPLSIEIEQRVRDRVEAVAGRDVACSLVVRMVSSLRKTVTTTPEVRTLFTATSPDPATIVTTVAAATAASVTDAASALPPATVAANADAAPTSSAPASACLSMQPCHVYAESYSYRQRVLLLWQRLDGVDVCLFALYVQEYGPDCPPPNTNKVYIAYLDSVRYLRPLTARTAVYHEVLTAYLSNARARGLETVYIWACPPQRGDGYIFHVHPPSQRVPNKERLREWYDDMLRLLQEDGVVSGVRSLFDEYFEVAALQRVPDASRASSSKPSTPQASAAALKPLAASSIATAANEPLPAAAGAAAAAGTKRRASRSPDGGGSTPAADVVLPMSPIAGIPLSAARDAGSPSATAVKKVRMGLDVSSAVAVAVPPPVATAPVATAAATTTARPVGRPPKSSSAKNRSKRQGGKPRPSGSTPNAGGALELIQLRPEAGLLPFFAGDFWALETERFVRDMHKRLYNRVTGASRRRNGTKSGPADPVSDAAEGVSPSSPAATTRTTASAPKPRTPSGSPTSRTDTVSALATRASAPPLAPGAAGAPLPSALMVSAPLVPIAVVPLPRSLPDSIPAPILRYMRSVQTVLTTFNGHPMIRVGDVLIPRNPIAALAARIRDLRREFIVVHLTPLPRAKRASRRGGRQLGVAGSNDTSAAATSSDEAMSEPSEDEEQGSLDTDARARGNAPRVSTRRSATLPSPSRAQPMSRSDSSAGDIGVHPTPVTSARSSSSGRHVQLHVPAGSSRSAPYADADSVMTPTVTEAAVSVVSRTAAARAVADSDRANDESITCDFFDTRHGFLRMCQGNNYQFDTLRRAKHSSMMILWHLHNPKVPAYAQICKICENDIGAATRWHCDTCYDYDICEACYQRSNAGNSEAGVEPHAHPLIPLRDARDEQAAGTDAATDVPMPTVVEVDEDRMVME